VPFGFAPFALGCPRDEKPITIPIYDESAYTERVESTMNVLNKRYRFFCDHVMLTDLKRQRPELSI
jgi:hypothetical protein